MGERTRAWLRIGPTRWTEEVDRAVDHRSQVTLPLTLSIPLSLLDLESFGYLFPIQGHDLIGSVLFWPLSLCFRTRGFILTHARPSPDS